MVHWMVTGAGGALGTDLTRLLADRSGARPDDSVTALRRDQLDVTDPDAVRAAVRGWAAQGRPTDPLVLVNAAAFTAVDRAETDPAASEAAWAVNAEAPGHLAAACGDAGAWMIHVSTDYVFSGGLVERPREPDDPTAPVGVYARSKLAGEQRVREALADAHHVVRTAWVYGDVGTNFVRTIAGLLGERDTVAVVDDQRGSPTWSADLAAGLVALGRAATSRAATSRAATSRAATSRAGAGRAATGRAVAGRDGERSRAAAGTLHAAGGGSATWYDLACGVAEEMGADPQRVQRCSSDRFPRPAPRPSYSVLSDASWRAAGLTPLPAWRPALSAAVRRHPDLLGPIRR